MLPLRDSDLNKKRHLKKVRVHFINKKGDPEPIHIDPATKYLNSDQTYTLIPILGFVERSRKLYLGPEYLNQCYKISHSEVQDQLYSKLVTLYLSQSDIDKSLIPWEYSTKRLESYGDLDLSVWARRIRNYNINYSKLMENYYDSIQSNDPEAYDSLLEIEKKIALACEEIENRHKYYKITYFMTKEASKLVSLSYNEGFLKEIGHTVESFLRLTNKNGIPSFCDSNCQIFLDLVKRFFDGTLNTYGPPIIGSNFLTALLDKDGNSREVRACFINFIKPVNEGFYFYSYLTLESTDSHMNFKAPSACKYIKRHTNIEETISAET